VPVAVYEARERIGGRCWSARGFADGQVAEHGGEFIDTRHVHLRQPARQLGLELDDLYAARYGPYSPVLVGGRLLRRSQIAPVMRRISRAAEAEARRLGVLRPDGSVTTGPISYPTSTPAARAVDRLAMSECLDRRVPGVLATRVGEWLDVGQLVRPEPGRPLRAQLDRLLRDPLPGR
jgi:monoamine oxidase